MTTPTDGTPVTHGHPVVAWWGRVGLGKRLVAVVVAAAIVLNGGLVVVNSVTGGADPGGHPSSAYATGRQGLAAYADLLAAKGRIVVLSRTPLGTARLDPRATLVVADPDTVSADDVAALRAFVARGGRLLVTGLDGSDVGTAVTGIDQGWAAPGVRHPRPLLPVAGLAGVPELDAAGLGALVTPGSAVPLLGRDGRVVATELPVGRGSVVVVADSSLVQNERLGHAGNAALALALTGGRPVVFAEAVHGYGNARGLAALPGAARWSGIALLVVALLGVWVYGQRFGPPERDHRTLPPPRRAYVDALAAALGRTGDPVGATAGLRDDARNRIRDRAGVGRDEPDEVLAAAAVAAGVPAGDVEAVLGPPRHDHGSLTALGRAAAHLRGGPR